MCESLKLWWPGTELNRRRQPFQACYQLISLPFFNNLTLRSGQFCDHSVTSADIRLASAD
jgi:hypothetical protein